MLSSVLQCSLGLVAPPNAVVPNAVVPQRTAAPTAQAAFDVEQLPGVTGPLGFFDPLGFSSDASKGKIKFYREAEIKHGRVAMLASVGFFVGEHFHPMWGGNLNLPSVIAFQETPLQDFLPGLAVLFFIHEFGSIFTFNSPFGGEVWSIRSDYASGNLGWDPLGLKPTDPSELKVRPNANANPNPNPNLTRTRTRTRIRTRTRTRTRTLTLTRSERRHPCHPCGMRAVTLALSP